MDERTHSQNGKGLVKVSFPLEPGQWLDLEAENMWAEPVRPGTPLLGGGDPTSFSGGRNRTRVGGWGTLRSGPDTGGRAGGTAFAAASFTFRMT